MSGGRRVFAVCALALGALACGDLDPPADATVGDTSRPDGTAEDTGTDASRPDTSAPETGADASGDACVPTVEICGDRVDQNCDGRDTSCGDSDGDRFEACRAGEDLTMCDCNDDEATAYPGHPEECDGFDNDCNGRIDEVAECCAACAGMPAGAGDICTEDGQCDCAGEPGIGICATGQTCCGGGCTDIQSDVANCGFCGTACNDQADRCTAGRCMCGSAPVCDADRMCSGGSC